MCVSLSDLVVNEKDIEGKLPCGYTHQEILLLLHKHCSSLCEQLDAGDKVKLIKFNDINNGQGFISCIFKTTIEFQSDTEPFKVVLKIPTDEKLVNSITDGSLDAIVEKTHRTECEFYKMFANLNDGFAPKIYYLEIASKSRPGIIIMEDLSEQCSTLGMFKSGTIEQFWNVARMIAHFQAVVAYMHEQEWKSAFVDDFHMDSFHTSIFEPIIHSLVEYDPSLKEPVREMRQVLSKRFSKYALVDKPAEYNSLILCHGDLWSNNILFEKNQDGAVSNSPLRFIDWQLAFTGNPFFDLARYLISANDGEIRREIQDQVVDNFVKILSEEHQKQGNGSIKVSFTLEQAHELFDLAFVEQTIVIMVLVPFVLNEQSSKNGLSSLLRAKADKIALRCKLCIEDALEIIEKRQLHNLFN